MWQGRIPLEICVSSCIFQLLPPAEIFGVFQCESVSPVTSAPSLEVSPVLGSPAFLHRSHWIRALVCSRKSVTTSFTDKVAFQGVEGSRLQPVLGWDTCVYGGEIRTLFKGDSK